MGPHKKGNLNADVEIKVVEVKTKLGGQYVNYKAEGFANDINNICREDQGNVQRIFEQYARVMKRLGLTLNADKIEILALHVEGILEYKVV